MCIICLLLHILTEKESRIKQKVDIVEGDLLLFCNVVFYIDIVRLLCSYSHRSHQPIREHCVVMNVHVSNEYYCLFWSWVIMTEGNVDSTHLHLIRSLFLFKHCPVVLIRIMLDVLNGSAFDKPVSFTNALIIITLKIISRQLFQWKANGRGYQLNSYCMLYKLYRKLYHYKYMIDDSYKSVFIQVCEADFHFGS